MMLRKDLVDELIRVTKKYYRTGDIDILPAVNDASESLEKNCKASFDVLSLIGNLAKFSAYVKGITYKDIYKALEIFGVIVE